MLRKPSCTQAQSYDGVDPLSLRFSGAVDIDNRWLSLAQTWNSMHRAERRTLLQVSRLGGFKPESAFEQFNESDCYALQGSIIRMSRWANGLCVLADIGEKNTVANRLEYCRSLLRSGDMDGLNFQLCELEAWLRGSH